MYFQVSLSECFLEQYESKTNTVVVSTTAKAKEMLEEVEDAETMVNMTREAADQAMMQAMDADQRAKNASARMDQLIQVSCDK